MGTVTNSLPITALETKHLGLKRIGWLYPIFRDVYFHHGLLASRTEQVLVFNDLWPMANSSLRAEW